MRMFRFPSWISESRGAEDVVHGVTDHLMASAKQVPPRQLAVQAVPGGAKRKRDDDRDAPASQQDQALESKRRKTGQMGASSSTQRLGGDEPQQTNGSLNMNEKPGGAIARPIVSTGVLRDAINSQFGLEILIRHQELEVINQNLAKAQIALEQLRRCHLIPFPTAQGTPEARQNISAGTGPAVTTRFGNVQPAWAAPYGVTNGPYSRHYARWLIPDSTFDGELPEWELEKTHLGKAMTEGRTTRNSNDLLTPAAKARTPRGSMGQKLQALPNGYTQSKENAGPSILKRPDGQLVKLVCLDCKRENFGSTQGFINHCRIAHKREFKSHEEAAVQSGVPIELDDVGGIVGEEKAPPVATGLVHPLITQPPTDPNAYLTILTRIHQSMNMFNQGKLPGVKSIPGQQSRPNPNFVQSSETPNLSKFMQAKGFDMNLEEAVNEAKKKPDMDDYSSHGEDEDVEMDNTPRDIVSIDGTSDTPVPAMRMPARATISATSFGRPGSSKGPDSSNGRKPIAQKSGISPRLPYATPINTAAAVNHNRRNSHVIGSQSDHSSDEEMDETMLDIQSIHDLSPNTIASNNAPSLVSDDDEYDEGDDDGESSIDGSDDEEEGSDVAEINFEDGDVEDKVLPSSTLRHRGALQKEAKHVTFVSPVKERRTKARAA